MNDITKLADKWRCGSTAFRYMSTKEILCACADALEDAIPKWTKITEDESTWPDADMFPVLIVWQQDSSVHVHEAHNTAEIGDKWRPLCSIDYPPEESE